MAPKKLPLWHPEFLSPLAMELPFWKMNGAGNDFVMLDNRDQSLSLSQAQIERLCQRQRGIGADGLIAVEPAEAGSDFRMRYYNADGGEAEMCGNGARCFARFVQFLDGSGKEHVTFETMAGEIGADFYGDQVKIALSDPFDASFGSQVELLGDSYTLHFLNTGVPHAVVFVDDLASVDVKAMGAAIRYHERFAPAGTNANFAQVLADQSIAIRTYERGVEDETLACGTGMAACALAHHQLTKCGGPIQVTVAGGDTLEVDFAELPSGDFHEVTLLGPADFTFAGTYSGQL